MLATFSPYVDAGHRDSTRREKIRRPGTVPSVGPDSEASLTEVNLVTAVLAGAASFLSPCVLPLLPGYISLMSGYSVQDLSDGNVSMRRVTGTTGLFVLGFTAVFVGLGATATSLSRWLNTPALTEIAGWAIIVMGIFVAVTAVWTPSWLLPVMRERRVDSHGARRFGYLGLPLMGAAFAFGWTPCIGPFLGSALSLGWASETVGEGMLLLFFYSLGLGIPFLVTSLLLAKAFSAVDRVKRHLTAITVASGLLLAGFGVLMVTGRITMISGFVADLMEWLGLEHLTLS